MGFGLATQAALAEPQLRLAHEPPPRHLRMRPRAAAAAPPPAPRPATPMPAAPAPLSQADLGDRADELAALRDVREPVSFSLTLGYQVDGARPSGKPSLDGSVPNGREYDALRSYGFGELFFSTRGVMLDSLSSYLALRFDATQPRAYRSFFQIDPVRIAPPIATWFDRNTFETRTGWAEMKDFLPKRFGLRKLRFRAGNQYIYGPWVLHLDGALLAYDGDIVTASAYAGGRHSDYTADLTNERYAVSGASVRADLRRLVSLPIAISGETLALRSYTEQPSSAHHQLEIDWQPRRDFTVFGQIRVLDNHTRTRLANERLQFRARYHEVTNVVFDVMRRFDSDWQWDPSLIANDDAISARRYLDLGPVVPQFVASLRGGTLIAENVDLLARGAIARNSSKPTDPRSSFSPEYVELGGALEVRLRRAAALSASLLRRSTDRKPRDAPITDVQGPTDPLPDSAETGETRFTEAGTRLRLSLGARQFSAMVEVYGRWTTYAESYQDPVNPIDPSDFRGGGRVTLDAWIGKRLRLFALYDLSSAIEHTPEITAFKSLRLTMTGVY